MTPVDNTSGLDLVSKLLDKFLFPMNFDFLVGKMGGNGNSFKYGRTGRDGSIWGAVAEKMFAKWYGNYEHLQGGWMHRAVTALNGSPA